MILVSSVHIAGNYEVLWDEGIEWLEDLCEVGAKTKVFTTLNPQSFDFGLSDGMFQTLLGKCS